MVDSYFSTNLALIYFIVSEKTRFTDGRRINRRLTTDVCDTSLALLTQSSRANYLNRLRSLTKLNYITSAAQNVSESQQKAV